MFGLEIEDCARCGGKLKAIASIEAPKVIAKNLLHLEKNASAQPQPAQLRCARAPPGQANLIRTRG